MGWFSILPSLDLSSSRGGGDEFAALNEFMARVQDAAKADYATQAVFVSIEGRTIFWRDEEFDLPDDLAGCQINRLDPSVFGDSFPFRVFRDGIMEDVRLVLADGTVLQSDVIGVRFFPLEGE